MVVSLILVLPSALALNCTKYYGDNQDLCNNINPLDLSESNKLSLMEDNVYGDINSPNPSVNLQLNQNSEEPITFETIYEEKIVFIGRFSIFLIFIYSTYSILTKSRFIRKWLVVDY